MTYETYITVDGDSVDLIAFRRFGQSSGQVELIYDANTGLVDHGPALPAGLVVRIPVPGVPDRAQSTRLWD